MERTPTFEKYYDEAPWYDSQSNDPLLRDEAYPLTVENLRKAAYRLGELGRNVLAVVKEYADGYNEFLCRHPEFSGKGTMGNRLLAFSLLNPYQPPTANAFEEIADRQGRPLTKSVEYHEQQQEVLERRNLIQEISQGRETYRWRRPEDGKILVYQTSGLNEESTDRLIQIHDLVVGQRRLLGLNPADVHKEVSATTREQWQAKTAPATVELINPATGLTYTRSELLQMIAKQDRAEFRRLLFTRSGQPIPGAAEAIDKILGVKPRSAPGESIKFNL